MEGGPSAFPQGSSCLVVLRIPAGAARISRTRLSLSLAGLPRPFCYPYGCLLQSLPRHARTTVWALPRSLAATYGIDVSFSSSAYLDVSVRRVPPAWLWIYHAVAGVFPAGFPHSEICGSPDICSSPQLFAAYHVLLRLSVPRHPPCALLYLTFPVCRSFAHRGFSLRSLLILDLFF